MFTVELNIGAIATPVAGGGWVVMAPDIKDTKIKLGRGDTDILERIQLEGGITFLSDEYIALKELKDDGNLLVEYRIKFDSVIQITGEMPLFGEWETGEKEVKLTTKPADLIGKVKANLSKDLLLRSQEFTTQVNHDFTSSLRSRYLASVFAGSPAAFSGWDRYSSNGSYTVSAWNSGATYSASQEIVTDLYWGFDGLDTLVSNGGQSFVSLIDSNLNNEPTPGGDANWLRVDAAPDRHSQEYADFEFDAAEWIESPTESTDAHSDEWQQGSTGTDSYTFTLTTIPLFSLLTWLLAQIDATIDLYQATIAANTGFCEYIETNFPNKLKLYYKSYETEPKITLQTIIDIYENMFNCKWTIEGTILVFRHESERPTLLGSDPIHNLTTYESRDWTVYKFTDEPQNYKLERWKYSDNSHDDFQPAEIDYGTPYEDTLERNIGISVDIKHAVIEESGELIVAATGSAPNITLYNVTGIVSGLTAYNGSLAPVQCVSDHFQEGRLFSDYDSWTGGTVLSLTVRRMKIVELEAQILDLTGLTLRDWLFRTNLAFLEVSEIVVSLAGDIAKFKAVY